MRKKNCFGGSVEDYIKGEQKKLEDDIVFRPSLVGEESCAPCTMSNAIILQTPPTPVPFQIQRGVHPTLR
jgi:hypothetical protein